MTPIRFVCIPLLASATSAQASLLVMDFANNAGLGYNVGTTQTINQNGVQMSVLSGAHEITIDPFQRQRACPPGDRVHRERVPDAGFAGPSARSRGRRSAAA